MEGLARRRDRAANGVARRRDSPVGTDVSRGDRPARTVVSRGDRPADGVVSRREQPIRSAAPANEPLVRVPDDWTVWAFSDPHGVASGFTEALRAAGLVDARLRWTAPPRTALVGCGDYLDRGTASRPVVELLARLQEEAPRVGGRVVLARGNHEHLLLQLLSRPDADLETWLRYGGGATLRSWGVGPPDPASPRATVLELESRSPGLTAWLGGLVHGIRWRDVLFVHGGLPPHSGPDDLGRETEAHLWVRGEFFTAPWESGVFGRYEAAGVHRVVFGHTPQPRGIRLFHDGRSLALDTNACGNPHMPEDARLMVTLLRLEGDMPLGEAPTVVVPTDDAPDRHRG